MIKLIDHPASGKTHAFVLKNTGRGYGIPAYTQCGEKVAYSSYSKESLEEMSYSGTPEDLECGSCRRILSHKENTE